MAFQFKWKTAFLYSNERLIPIFKANVLHKIAKSFKVETIVGKNISTIQEIMMQRKPSGVSIYEYAFNLWKKFDSEKYVTQYLESSTKNKFPDKITKNNFKKRKSSDYRNTKSKVIKVNRSFVIEQKHNKLQLALYEKLVKEFGGNCVLLEENFVDIKLLQPNHVTFYEVKSDAYASDCVRKALGQLLTYTFYDTDDREKKLVVVGQYAPNPNEVDFINYIKSILDVEFEYESVSLA